MRESLYTYCRRTGKTHLLDEWSDDRDGDLTPDSVTAASGKRVWWQCANGHTWQTAVYARTKQDAGCPYCSNHFVWQGYNDLASQAPEVAAQWYQPMNGEKTPETVLVSSHYKAWWRCPLGHIWRTEVLVRTVLGCNCPICAGQEKIAHHLECLPLQVNQQTQQGSVGMDISNILDQIDEIVYISDLESNELLFLNRYGRNRFGDPKPGAKCYAHLQNRAVPCSFCTNELLPRCPGQRHTWVRPHPRSGSMLLHDSIIEYEGRKCRMELAIDINHCASDLDAARMDLAAERKLVACIETLAMSNDFEAAINSMLRMIIEHYDADRAYIFEFDWEKNLTHNTYEICKDGITPQIGNLQNVPIDVVAVWVDVFQHQQKKINIIGDVDALKDDPARRIEYDCLHPQGISSLITVPIFVGGKLHGFLGVDNPASHMDAPELLMQVTYIAANELQKRLLTEELTEKSYHDPLTGLQNRLAYEEKLLALQNGSERPIGVGFVDINGLKYLNDTLGHDYGNKALLRACDVMKTYFEPEILYRVSGDEFIILWTDVGFQSFRETCDLMAQELHGAQEELASFGCTWGTAGEELPKLIREAEQRMYDEKRRHYLRSETTALARPQYLDALLQEFRDSTFQIYLQPLYSIEQGRVYAAEGLVRKIDPRGKMHAPIEFIHMMEQERMISMVDYEMLRQACGLLVKWKAAWPEFRIGCNMSRITLAEPDYLNTVDKILAETGADPKCLTFEITEGSQGIQLESMGSLLDALRARGITLALDDMGTEAACLEMLYLPQIQNVKIDRSLICRAENSEREQTVIRHLVDLCHDLNMTCVAEGIETDSQIELLKQLGCDRLQGYKIGKPMPPEEFFARFAPR